MKIAELFAELGFKMEPAQEAKLQGFSNALTDLNLSSLAAAAGLGVAGLALGKLVEESSKYAIGLEMFSSNTGFSTSAIQQWEQAVTKAGGSAEDARASLKGLQKLMLDVQLGTGNAGMAWSVFGIKAGDDPVTMAMKMSKVLKEDASPALKSMMASQMNITEGFQYFLQTTLDVNKALHDTQGTIMDPKQVAELAELWKNLSASLIEIKKTGNDIASTFGPTFQVLLSLFNDILIVTQIWHQTLRNILISAGLLTKMGIMGVENMVNSAPSGGSTTGVAQQTNHFHFPNITNPVDAAHKVEAVLRKALSDATYQDPAGSV